MHLRTNNRMETIHMAQPSTRPMRRTWLPRLFKVINVPMRLLLRLPFNTPLSRQLILLSFTGRCWSRPAAFAVHDDHGEPH